MAVYVPIHFVTMSSAVVAVFKNLADQFSVQEGDWLAFKSLGIQTCDELYFRVPSPEKFESL